VSYPNVVVNCGEISVTDVKKLFDELTFNVLLVSISREIALSLLTSVLICCQLFLHYLFTIFIYLLLSSSILLVLLTQHHLDNL